MKKELDNKFFDYLEYYIDSKQKKYVSTISWNNLSEKNSDKVGYPKHWRLETKKL